MELKEIGEVARSVAVMIRIQGPDPKGLKMRSHAFHQHELGRTTLSASGMLIPDSLSESQTIKHLCRYKWQQDLHMQSSVLVLTTASIVEPFLKRSCQDDPHVLPNLIAGAEINVLAESMENSADSSNRLDHGSPKWLPAQLLSLVDIPLSFRIVQSLMEAHGMWDVGWSLVPASNSSHPTADGLHKLVEDEVIHLPENQTSYNLSKSRNHVASSNTRMALLGVPRTSSMALSHIAVSPRIKKGDFLIAVGSPFGLLSPLHFLNSVTVGVVSNCCPPGSPDSSLLMADLRCLPGMEGGPVFCDHANLVGILTRPLRHRDGGAEIQLVITWDAITTAARDQQNEDPGRQISYQSTSSEKKLSAIRDSKESIHSVCDHSISISSLQSPLEKAMASIVLISVGVEAWASGIILNQNGLILTNAHLLEPWRFGKMDVSAVSPSSKLFSKPASDHMETDVHKLNMSNAFKFEDRFSYKKVCVRLDHVVPQIWCDASIVYVSKGPLDIALLQLDSVPGHLCPIVPLFTCPSPGSKIYVIGHGLFGPQAGLSPSISHGTVAKVVQVQNTFHLQLNEQELEERFPPAMIQTTAAVHPGFSGGAVVNLHGDMIGLVTSNAKHKGVAIIPHLNFSIPCSLLRPVFEFSRGMQDPFILRALDEPNDVLSSLWALKPLKPKPDPSQKEPILEQINKGKGTRFARFLAEKQAELSRASLPSQSQPTGGLKLSTSSFPSKL